MKNSTSSDCIKHFESVVMELKYDFNSLSLDSEIQRIAEGATVSERFLIKMEIMNLAKKVQRIIDLRSFFKDSCEKFTFQGVSHYLDNTAKAEFNHELSKYGGNYTLGVYNQIIQKAKIRHKSKSTIKAPAKKTRAICLTQFNQRKDERLYFVKKIYMFYNCPEKMPQNVLEQFAIEGITTDISLSGLSIKIPKEQVRRADGIIHVWMRGIESEFKLSEHLIITYEIKRVAEKNDHIYFNLAYHNEQFSKAKNEFLSFVKSYVATQKKRNNVLVENTINAIKIKGAEQFIIARLRSLPIFLMQHNEIWLPAAQFQTRNNTEVGLLPDTSCNKGFLYSLCLLPSIQLKIALGNRFSDYLFIVPVRNANNKTFYLALPHQKVASNAVMKEMTIKAHKQNKLKLYRIDGNSTFPDEQCYVPSSLPASAREALEVISPRTKNFTNALKRMLVLSDVTDSIDHLALLNSRSELKEKNITISEFLLKETASPIDLYNVTAETNNYRSEDRFICNMKVLIQKKPLETNTFVSCTTINISTKGLKLKLSEAMNLDVGDEVFVQFPELSGNHQKEVNYSPYSIAGKDSELEYRLFIKGKGTDHQGRKMINQYINKNIDTILRMQDNNGMYGLSQSLRNIFTNNLHLAHGITAKEGSNRYINYIATSENAAVPDINDNNKDNMLELMETNAFRSAITNKIELINKEAPYEQIYFFVVPRVRNNGEHYFFIKQIAKSQEYAELYKLIQELELLGKPRLLRIQVTKKNRIFNKYFRDEMLYLKNFAVTKLKNIESELRDTAGVFEISDVTELITH